MRERRCQGPGGQLDTYCQQGGTWGAVRQLHPATRGRLDTSCPWWGGGLLDSSRQLPENQGLLSRGPTSGTPRACSEVGCAGSRGPVNSHGRVHGGGHRSHGGPRRPGLYTRVRDCGSALPMTVLQTPGQSAAGPLSRQPPDPGPTHRTPGPPTGPRAHPRVSGPTHQTLGPPSSGSLQAPGGGAAPDPSGGTRPPSLACRHSPRPAVQAPRTDSG